MSYVPERQMATAQERCYHPEKKELLHTPRGVTTLAEKEFLHWKKGLVTFLREELIPHKRSYFRELLHREELLPWQRRSFYTGREGVSTLEERMSYFPERGVNTPKKELLP